MYRMLSATLKNVPDTLDLPDIFDLPPWVMYPSAQQRKRNIGEIEIRNRQGQENQDFSGFYLNRYRKVAILYIGAKDG